jgi:hypothetical protein
MIFRRIKLSANAQQLIVDYNGQMVCSSIKFFLSLPRDF